MRAHNIEFEIWQRLAYNHRNPMLKWYLSLLAKRLKKFEIQELGNMDVLIPITKRDKAVFVNLGFSKRSCVIEAGVDKVEEYSSIPTNKNCFFLGALDWMPNKEGIMWFLNKVWSKVRAQLPDATIDIAGRNFPLTMKKISGNGVKIIGEVPDAKIFMQDKAIMIVPLLSGSGMRIKIIEAMAMGKTVISTAIGAEGISYTSGKDILIADNATEFANALIRCMKDQGLVEQLGENAIHTINHNYLNHTLVKKLLSFYQNELQN